MNYKDQKIIEIRHESNYVIIDWVLGNFCNYKCSYCFPGSNTGDQRPPKISEEIKNNIQHLVSEIKKHHKEEKIINFTLSGGEPTMYHDLENLVSFLKSLGVVTIITNGSRTLDWWKNNWHHVDFAIISYHTESADFDHISQLTTFLSSKISVSLHVIMHYENFQSSVDTYNRFYNNLKNYQIDIIPKFIRLRNGQLPYDQNQKKILMSLPVEQRLKDLFINEKIIIDTGTHVETFNSKTLGNLTGSYKFDYTCAAHTQFLQIDRFGNIGKISCGTKFNEEVNVLDLDFIKKFKIEKTYVQCQSQNCNCLGLHKTSKKLVNNPKYC